MRLATVLALAAGLSGAALADQPRAAAPAATTCSLSGRICATRDAAGVVVWRKLPGGRQRPLWRAAARGQEVQVADDGRSLVEVQPWANLVEADAGPGTPIFTFLRPNGAPVRVTLGEMVRNVAALPRTVSHRRWATGFGYDERSRFAVDTVEGRHLLFDPARGGAIAG